MPKRFAAADKPVSSSTAAILPTPPAAIEVTTPPLPPLAVGSDTMEREKTLASYKKSNEARRQKREKESSSAADASLPAIEEGVSLGEPSSSCKKRKRSIHDRPEEWRVIAEHYDLWGKSKTWAAFKELLGDRTQRSVDQALKTWSRDLRENKGGLKGKRAPAYGFPIDLLLLQEVQERIQQSMPVDDVTLHSLLVHQLEVHGRLELMSENGGSHLFLHGWAGRFWKRHNLPSRLVSAKEQKTGRSSSGESGSGSNGIIGGGGGMGVNSNVVEEEERRGPVSAAAQLIELHSGATTKEGQEKERDAAININQKDMKKV